MTTTNRKASSKTIPAASRIITISRAVRSACEKLFPRRKGLRNLCTLSACAIAEIGKSKGVRVDLLGGTFRAVAPIHKPEFGNLRHIRASRAFTAATPHAWVKHGRNYIDVTLTQFVPEAEPVSILELDDKRYRGNVEPLEFAERILPLCGSSTGELKRVIAEAKRILKAVPHA